VLDSTVFSSVTGLPSTTSAAGVSTGLVRRLRRYYARVRLLAGVPVRIALLASRTGPAAGRPPDAREVSRFSRVQFLDVRTALGLRRAWRRLALSHPSVWPSLGSTRSAPGTRFSKLDSSPVDASVYTSPGTSRHPAQDSRSRWFATPFLWGSLIPDCTPVYPDACAP
jgi:hypothetical protein